MEKTSSPDFVSWEKIKSNFPDQWVAIINPKLSDDDNFLGGKVFYANKDKDVVYQKAKELGAIDIYFRYTGEIPFIAGLAKMEITDAQT